jgi:Pacifastin inhibitor (LCMII)
LAFAEAVCPSGVGIFHPARSAPPERSTGTFLARKAAMMNAQSRVTIPVAIVSTFVFIGCSKSSLNTNSNGKDAASDGFPDLPGLSCNYQGTQYAIGQTFKSDCNTCNCTVSGVACTLMACESWTGGASGSMGGTGGAGGSAGVGGYGGAGGSTSSPDAAPQGCVEGGHTYAVGETFKRDCNTCTCTANGASCSKMACPVDASPDLQRNSDAGQTCSFGGRSYAIGESFKSDCNTCNCTSNGVACTTMACFQDAGPDLPATLDSNSTCSLSTNLTFGYDGGNAIYWDVNRLTATTFSITRNYSMRAGFDGATTASCSPSLPVCGSTGAVTIATITADLAQADVQSSLGVPPNPVPIYGMDTRPTDGAIYSIALDDGRKVFVGGQCASPAMSSCRYVPAGLVQLTQDLQKLASAMISDPACKAVF